jgi:hypothetical protein
MTTTHAELSSVGFCNLDSQVRGLACISPSPFCPTHAIQYSGKKKTKANQQLLGICGICHDPLEDGITAECGHAFCRICVSDYLGTVQDITTCPTCKRPLSIDLQAPATSSAVSLPPPLSPIAHASYVEYLAFSFPST